MKWKENFIKGVFVKRYKRFFADVLIDGKLEVSHVANTGSLKSCLEEGRECLLSRSDNPERKLKFSLQALKSPHQGWIGINTQVPNQLIKELFEEENEFVKHWKKFDEIIPEYKLNKQTRLDAVLVKDDKKHYIEVKNVSLLQEDKKGKKYVCFPDAVTERGQKHLREMIDLLEQGFECEMIYMIQRIDADYFTSANEIDPEYGKLLRNFKKAGGEITPLVVEVNEKSAKVIDKLKYVESI